ASSSSDEGYSGSEAEDDAPEDAPIPPPPVHKRTYTDALYVEPSDDDEVSLEVLVRKRRHQVWVFGTTVWELVVGKHPLDDRGELTDTPEWVQKLVNGCRGEATFASMDDVVEYLDANRE